MRDHRLRLKDMLVAATAAIAYAKSLDSIAELQVDRRTRDAQVIHPRRNRRAKRLELPVTGFPVEIRHLTLHAPVVTPRMARPERTPRNPYA